ncbi:MAG: M48 family metallopeptidase [Atopobiaceae bacterium]|nr:M48 family metallopeptidase [Atopobiaceae bacterium]
MIRRQTKTNTPTSIITVDELPVELSRKRVRRINLRIRPDATVAVSAPARTPIRAIETFVRSRREWIERAQERCLQQQAMHNSVCKEGAFVTLWGEKLTCHLMADVRSARCQFEASDNQLIVRCPTKLLGDDEQATSARSKALDRWLREELRKAAEELLPRCQQVVGKECSQLRIRSMSSRWGSCNTATGAITLSTHLVHYDADCVEYVLIHELCHLHEPSHNARFHTLMDQFYPTWRKSRAKLNRK